MKGSTDHEEMFAQSTARKAPWSIDSAEFNEEERDVRVYVKARKTSKYPCPKCGKKKRTKKRGFEKNTEMI